MPLFPGKTCFPFSADNPLAYTDSLDQLNVIFDIVGTPTAQEIAKIENDRARSYLRSLPAKKKLNLARRYPGADPRALDLLANLLKFDAEERFTAQHALHHAYLQEIRVESEEKLYNYGNGGVDWSFEDQNLNKKIIHGLIIQEILIDNPDLKPEQFNLAGNQAMKGHEKDSSAETPS
jgi:mitogen-activated protein kinase 1/3